MCFSHVCGYTCTYGCICVEAKVDTGTLPQLFFRFILLRQGLWLNLELTNPSKSLASLLQRSPASTFRGWNNRRVTMSTWHLHGVRASELPILLLACKNFSCQAIFPCIFYLREDLPTQFTKPETRSRPQLFILEVDFKETKRVTPGINSVSCPFIARLESRA